MALLKESTVTKPVTYTLRRSVGGYRVLYGGDDVGRIAKDGVAWSLCLTWDETRAEFATLIEARAWLESVRETRIGTFETPEFKRTVADACAKSPMRRSPLERAVVAMAFGAK
jgi:hypothetical protein